MSRPEPSLPAAAVIIPHFDDVDRLLRCLGALMPQVGPGVEVVVVDNGSTQSLDPVRTAHPDLTLVVEAESGAAPARNRGVAETTAERLIFLDSDCLPAPDWLARALTLEIAGKVVGGRVDVFDETPAPRSGAEAFETVFAFDNRGYIEAKGFSVTANIVTTRAVFAAVGSFRPGLSEDLDWCRRATAAGMTLTYDDGLRVQHPTRADWPALERKWRRLTREAWGLRERDAGTRLVWAARALAMPVSALVHAPRVLTSPALRDGGERRAALATLIRLRLLRGVWMLRQAAGGTI